MENMKPFLTGNDSGKKNDMMAINLILSNSGLSKDHFVVCRETG